MTNSTGRVPGAAGRGVVRFSIVALAVAVAAGCAPSTAPTPPATPAAAAPELSADTVRRDLDVVAQRLVTTAEWLPPTAYPVRTGPDGAWMTTGPTDWTSGFFPGSLWQMYALTRDPVWQARAETRQAGIEPAKTDDSSHDIGFQILDTFGQDADLTGDARARDVVLTAASTLATRYNPTVGAFRSWDARDDTTRFQTIMDNMMNLELMFWASQHGGDPRWAEMAATHARTTGRDFFRPDGGSWHVVNYDQRTGAVISKYTAQGYADDSTWSRGEAWAIHGFTTSYRYTHDPQFLATARTAADYFLAHLPADQVPYWDFSLPTTTGQPRDSSAAAVAASGLVELSRLEPDPARSRRDLDGARGLLAGLSSPAYLSTDSSQAVLLHGTQNAPDGNADTGLVFGDYYFVEALRRYGGMASPTG